MSRRHLTLRTTLACLIALCAAATGTASAQSTTPYPACLSGASNPAGAPYQCAPNCAFEAGTLTDASPPLLYGSFGGWGWCAAGMQSWYTNIGPEDSQSWTAGDSSGSMQPLGACGWTDTPSLVSLTAGLSMLSSTITATNWDTANAHNWAGGLYIQQPPASNAFTMPAGFTQSCVDNYGCLTNAAIQTCAQNVPATPSLWEEIEAAMGRAALEVRTARVTANAVVTRRLVTHTVGRHRLRCPAGTQLLDASSAMLGDATQPRPQVATGSASAATTIARIGARELLSLSIVCRASGQRTRHLSESMIVGTEKGSAFTVTTRDKTVFAGNGDDRVVATGHGDILIGGNGDDVIRVSGRDAVAQGGAGRDELIAVGMRRALLIGGPGADRLIARRGAPHINAADGTGGDVVMCEPGTRAVVRADADDTVTGPCARITRV